MFFLGLPFLVADLVGLRYVITPEMEQDSSLLVPFIRETIVSYQPLVGIGVIGAIVTYIVYYKYEYDAPWFLTATRVLGWLWMPFIPIGTLIGIVLLGARRSALDRD